MQTLRTTTAFVALATAMAAPAAADTFAIPEIVVSANIGETEASRTGTSVTVLDGADLTKTGEPRLTDILARQPGVGIRARGPVGTQTGVTIRGASQNYVKVQFDGIDMSDPSGPQVAYDFGRLTSFGLDRVEILRGSQSAVYGSQAIAGVISLQTALPEDDGIAQSVHLEAGSYNTILGAYGFGIRSAGGALGFNLSRIQTDGFSAANEADGNTEADGYEATRLSVRGEASLGEDMLIGFAGFIEQSDGDYDEQFPIADGSPDEVSTATSRGLRGYLRFGTGRVEHEIAASVFSIDRTLTGSTGFGASTQDYEGDRQTLGWTARMAAGPGDLTVGIDGTWESYGQVSDFGFGPSANAGDSRTVGGFAEWDAALSDAFDLTLSARADEHSEFGSFVTGRAAAAWRPTDDVILRASLGTGYRAPSGYELFGPFGDSTLTPEESTSADLGIEKRFGTDGFVRATLFWIETDNLIDYVGAGYTQIAGTTQRKGLELEGEASVTDRLRFSGAYTLTEARNPTLSAGNTWNSGFGRHQLALGLDADLSDRLTASLGVLHVADRPVLPDYTTLNATFSYDLGNAAEAYLRVENLGDEDYELVDGYGTSGRAFYVGLRKSF